MEINSTIQSYEDISSLEMFEENKEITLDNFENICLYAKSILSSIVGNWEK